MKMSSICHEISFSRDRMDTKTRFRKRLKVIWEWPIEGVAIIYVFFPLLALFLGNNTQWKWRIKPEIEKELLNYISELTLPRPPGPGCSKAG